MEPLKKHTHKHSVVTTDEEIDAAIAKASEIATEPRVVKASYVSGEGLDLLILEMSNKHRKAIPREEIQGLSDANSAVLNEIEISPNGTSLRWPSLDVDLYVPPLLEGIVGTREWMKHLGRQGGLATTPAKSKASRLNGMKGGRPRANRKEGKKAFMQSHGVGRSVLSDLNYQLFENRPENVTSPNTFKQYQALRGQSQSRRGEEGSYAAFSNSSC